MPAINSSNSSRITQAYTAGRRYEVVCLARCYLSTYACTGRPLRMPFAPMVLCLYVRRFFIHCGLALTLPACLVIGLTASFFCSPCVQGLLDLHAGEKMTQEERIRLAALRVGLNTPEVYDSAAPSAL